MALEKQLKIRDFRVERSIEGAAFGESMFRLVGLLGRDNPMFRWLVV